MPSVLLDAGRSSRGLIAATRIIGTAAKRWAAISDPLGTVWPAFTEAMYLLRSSARYGTCRALADFN